MTLLVTLSVASPADDGTAVHNTLIADYCAADDAGRDAILIKLEGYCLPTSKMMTRQEPSVTKLTLLFKKLGLTKQLPDKGLLMEFVKSTATYSQDDGLGVYHSHELFYEYKIVTSNMFVSSKSNSKQYI